MTPGDGEAAVAGGGSKTRGRNGLRSSRSVNQIDSISGEKEQRKPPEQTDTSSPDVAKANSSTTTSAAAAAVAANGSDGDSPSSWLRGAANGSGAFNVVPVAAPQGRTGCDNIEAQTTKSSPSNENDSASSDGEEAPGDGRSADNSQGSSTYRDRAFRSRANSGRPPLEVSTHTPGGGILAGGTGPPSSRRYSNFKTPRQTNVTVPSGTDASTNNTATDAMLEAIEVGSGIQRLMVMLPSLAGRYGFASALEFLESRNSLFPQVVHDAYSALFEQGHEGPGKDGYDGDYVDIEQQNPQSQCPDDTSAMGNETYGGGSVVDMDNNNAALLHDVQIRSFDAVHDPEEQKRMLQKISGEYLDIWCLEDCVKLGNLTDAKKAGRGHVDQSSVVAVLKLLQALNFYQSVTYLRVMAENGVPPKKEYSKKWFGVDKTTDQRNNFQDWWTAVVFSGKFDNIPGWVSQVKARHFGGALKDVNNYDLVLKSFGDKTTTISDLEKIQALSTSAKKRVEELEQAEAKEAKKKKKKGKKGGKGNDDSDGYVDIEEQSSRRESPDDTSAMGNDTYGGGSVVAEMDNNAALFYDVQICSFDKVLDPEEQRKMLRKISGEYLDVWCREDCVKLGTATDAKKAGKDQVKQSSLSPVLKKLKELNFFESATYLRFVAENGVPPKKEYTVRWFGGIGKDNTEDQRNNFRDWWAAIVFTDKFVNLPDTQLKERHLGVALKDKSVRYSDVLKAFDETEPDLEKLRALSKSVQERVEELEQKQTESETKTKN